jgi:hypothetical protein
MPVLTEERIPYDLFPTVVPGNCYTWDPESLSYIRLELSDTEPSDSLIPGKGYWVLSAKDTSYILTGEPFVSYDMEVKPGWNMIGSVAQYPNVHMAEDAVVYPDHILETPEVYWYLPEERRYTTGEETETRYKIASGKGYWALFNDDGVLRIEAD